MRATPILVRELERGPLVMFACRPRSVGRAPRTTESTTRGGAEEHKGRRHPKSRGARRSVGRGLVPRVESRLGRRCATGTTLRLTESTPRLVWNNPSKSPDSRSVWGQMSTMRRPGSSSTAPFSDYSLAELLALPRPRGGGCSQIWVTDNLQHRNFASCSRPGGSGSHQAGYGDPGAILP